MSMLSAQIDELREAANLYEQSGIARNTVTMLREAADTIWQLRDDLQRANAENAAMRQQLADVTESMGRVEERCAKLRELAEKAWKTAERLCQAFEGPCRDDGTTIYKPCPLGERDELCVYGLIQRDLRELGVEVE